MNATLKLGLLVTAVGFAMPAHNASAAVATHIFSSNAVNYCQAFTPGLANTIRNRVVGAENVGTADIAVACNFHSMTNGAPGAATPRTVTLWFANNNTTGSLTVTCTLLTGHQGEGGASQYSVAKTSGPIPSGGSAQNFVSFTQADNPVTGATTLGNSRIGVNCTLPQGAVMNDTYLLWDMDNGV